MHQHSHLLLLLLPQVMLPSGYVPMTFITKVSQAGGTVSYNVSTLTPSVNSVGSTLWFRPAWAPTSDAGGTRRRRARILRQSHG